MNGDLLAGLRLLDCSRFITGPYCASIFADLGADVIRIEPPSGSEDRALVPITATSGGAVYQQLNRNKRSLALDIDHPEGRSIFEKLVSKADVVITNLPVPKLKRTGLDYQTLAALKPDIITANTSAFGRHGPLSRATGFDAIAQGVSGAAYLGGTKEEPSRAASSYVDYGTGLATAVGIFAALLSRMKTGVGQDVHTSLLATALTFINAAHIEAAVNGGDRPPYGNRSPFSAPSEFFPTKDGTIMVQVIGDAMFARWAKLVGRAELSEDPRYGSDPQRGGRAAELSEIMRSWIGEFTTAQALERLQASAIPAAATRSPAGVISDPDIAASNVLGALSTLGAAVPLPVAQLIIDFVGVDGISYSPAPRLGEHSIAILKELDCSEESIRRLLDLGCIAA